MLELGSGATPDSRAANYFVHSLFLSLGASDRLSLAVEHSPARTKAYLGLRKL